LVLVDKDCTPTSWGEFVLIACACTICFDKEGEFEADIRLREQDFLWDFSETMELRTFIKEGYSQNLGIMPINRENVEVSVVDFLFLESIGGAHRQILWASFDGNFQFVNNLAFS
jgi:hypothetical protein